MNNLGRLEEAAARSDEARRFFKESLDLMRQLLHAEPHRADLQRGLSGSLNNLGHLARARERLDEARRFFQESLDVMRQLVQAEPHRVGLQRDLSGSLNNLGHLAIAADRLDEAPRYTTSPSTSSDSSYRRSPTAWTSSGTSPSP